MADSATRNAATQRDVRTPHSAPGSARERVGDQAFSDDDDLKSPHSTLTEGDEEPSGVVATLLAALDWLKERDLVPPGFATEPMPSLVDVIEHIRQVAKDKSDSPWWQGARMVWGHIAALPITCIAYLLAWASWFLTRLLFVGAVVMSAMTLLSWIPLVQWTLYWLTFPYWWHRLTGW